MDQVVRLDGLDIDGKPLVGEANAVGTFLEEFITFWQGFVRHLKIYAVVCLDGFTFVSVVVGHVLNQELGCTIFQGIGVILEMRQNLLHLPTVLTRLLKGTVKIPVACHTQKKRYKEGICANYFHWLFFFLAP